MTDYLLLLRVNLKSMLRGSLTAGARNDKGRIKVSYILLYLFALVGLVTLAGVVIMLETGLYQSVADFQLIPGMRLEKLLIGLAILLSMVMTLLFGIFHTLGAMYFNRDTAAMAHLPIGPRTQMMARWTEIYIGEILFSLLLLLPMLINHGVAQGGGVMYYLTAVLTLLTTPLYPLAIALLLASLLARVSTLTKHKEVWMVLGTVVLLALVLSGEWLLMPRISEDADAMFFLKLLANNEALLDFLIGAFPPVMWAVEAVCNASAMHLALFVLVGVAAVALVIFIMGSSFHMVCLMHTEHATKKTRATKRGANSFEKASPFMALIRREMNEVFKTPIYLMNAVMGVLMMPIMLMGMSVGITSSDSSIDLMQILSEFIEQIAPTDLMLIMTALFSFMVFICPVTATAISREGKRLPIMRMIPVKPRTILWAKLLVGLAIVAAGSLIMGAAIVVLLGMDFLPHVLGAVVMANILSCAVSIGNLLVDVIKPVLTWKSENEVMKQNLNTLFGMMISVVMTAIVAVPAFLLLEQAAWVRMVVVCALLAAELTVSVMLLEKVGCARLAKLEP